MIQEDKLGKLEASNVPFLYIQTAYFWSDYNLSIANEYVKMNIMQEK